MPTALQRILLPLVSSLARKANPFAMASTRAQPPWHSPASTGAVELPPLRLHNSLTMQKEAFVPESGRRIEWYSCGPTVYDMSHMGHARSYISFDIMRRIMSDYFKFDVHYVMNITDIDDKIIKRARQNYLFEKFKSEASDLERVRTDVREAAKRLEAKLAGEQDPDKLEMHKRDLARVTKALSGDSLAELLAESKDCLSDWLDARLGSTVNDNAIFEELPRRFEDEYFADMRALNIRDPDKLVRVSEVVPQIVDYCKVIIDRGFAYESNGSVYFDTQRFANAEGHFYAKLVPGAYGDQKLLQEGEGDLSIGADRLREKRSQADFALWKASKPGEPAWPSPWGMGRPGWHIECSVMASQECGPVLDIHTGGVDLKFPHHDNELAQAEAYFGHSHWVRYFLHAGHLTISGCKMSKSLKNFITIREALARHPASRLRLAFLLHSWKDTLDYSEETMTLAASFERLFADFFFNVARAVEEGEDDDATAENGHAAKGPVEEFAALVATFDDRLREALCDNLDTRRVLLLAQEAVSAANVHLGAAPRVRGDVLADLRRLAASIARHLDVFGVVHAPAEMRPLPEAFFGLERLPPTSELVRGLVRVAKDFVEAAGASKTLGDGLPTRFAEALRGVMVEFAGGEVASFDDLLKVVDHGTIASPLVAPDRDSALRKLLRVIADTRAAVRAAARERKLPTEALAACDRLRDETLSRLGVRLQDREGGAPAAVGFYPEHLLRAEREERAMREENKAAEKAAKAAAKATLEERGRQPPERMFLGDTDKYSAFDEKGLPTHDTEGKEVSKSALKKLQKLWDTQAKRHADWLKANDGAGKA